MRIAVPVKAVPDLVEEIELTADSCAIDREYLKFVLNEWDDQALEEALLLKEATGGEVTVLALSEDPDIDQVLYSAIAKGADRAVKISTGEDAPSTRLRATAFASWLRENPVDVVITGVQAPDDLDGQLPGTLAALLGLPHVSVVAAVQAADGRLLVRQEFSGGRAAELSVQVPAVIGLQAARQTPRYASISRIRQVMGAATLEQASADVSGATGPKVRRMYPPVVTSHARMIEGSVDAVAEELLGLLRERGLVKG